MIWYVDCKVKVNGDGSKDHPFMHIQDAANVAMAGDEVLVASGIYREDVSPVNAGTEKKPIVYRSAEHRGAIITGADVFKGWEQYQGDTWKLEIPNSYFVKGNPYTTIVFGDWLNQDLPVHTGEVFLNGKSLYEKNELEQVLNPEFYEESWDRDFTKHTWYTCQSETEDKTIIYANFQGKNPNEENVELNVRSHCFYPVAEHVNYITLTGFVVCKAATQWAPPTAHQEGMIGPHWSKGWVIEDCEISHSKCSGISLGKYKQQGNDNKWSHWKFKDGAQTQRDCSFIAQIDGWSKETIGSHTVRNCDIHDCGQTGIVGNLGCVFSLIENNHIHHINNKRNLAGAEIGGIKFHAAIDVVIRNNHFHDNVRGIWLDWQTQGTRVSNNLFHDNCLSRDYLLHKKSKEGLGLGEDLWIEIAHGPTTVDNNIFLSERAVKLPTQGVAFVHNLFYGSIAAVGRGVKNGSVNYDSTRYTPIHMPHRTEITGVMSILHGDVRFYNNVFVQPEVRQGMLDICEEDHDGEWDDGNLVAGTVSYNGYMTEKVWKSYFEGYCGEGAADTRDKYYMPLPVWTGGNVYFNGAKPCDIEEDFVVDTEHKATVELKVVDGKYTVETNVLDFLPKANLIESDALGMAFEPEERFENPDGSDIIFDVDYNGKSRVGHVVAGPFAGK
ncbi:MAG: right-handed parallel beta-helix repeat-containing protein [Lachnospiraceae bacterium]|nr:right-handed parallel beta-helix repeat-containing protein [Lachnospiraceae bacterium]